MRPLLVPAGSVSQRLANGHWLIRGWAFRETTGAATAIVTITDGQAVGAGQIIPIALAASESTRDFVPGDGIVIESGVFVEITGSVVGSILATPYDVSAAERE